MLWQHHGLLVCLFCLLSQWIGVSPLKNLACPSLFFSSYHLLTQFRHVNESTKKGKGNYISRSVGQTFHYWLRFSHNERKVFSHILKSSSLYSLMKRSMSAKKTSFQLRHEFQCQGWALRCRETNYSLLFLFSRSCNASFQMWCYHYYYYDQFHLKAFTLTFSNAK